jgi:hypothetical protein
MKKHCLFVLAALAMFGCSEAEVNSNPNSNTGTSTCGDGILNKADGEVCDTKLRCHAMPLTAPKYGKTAEMPRVPQTANPSRSEHAKKSKISAVPLMPNAIKATPNLAPNLTAPKLGKTAEMLHVQMTAAPSLSAHASKQPAATPS